MNKKSIIKLVLVLSTCLAISQEVPALPDKVTLPKALDVVLQSPTNFLDTIKIVCRAENPMRNFTVAGNAIEALDVQRGIVLASCAALPTVRTKIGADKCFENLNSRRNVVSMADPKSFESAISYLDAASEHYRKAGVDESIKQLELSEMSYPEARNRIYGILYKANNVLTDELFKGSERFDTNKNAALVNLCEACLQIAYANSVIEAARSAKQP